MHKIEKLITHTAAVILMACLSIVLSRLFQLIKTTRFMIDIVQTDRSKSGLRKKVGVFSLWNPFYCKRKNNVLRYNKDFRMNLRTIMIYLAKNMRH